MAMGYDVAELLADIKAKDEQLALLVPNNFTETEIKWVISMLHSAHSEPERVPTVAAVLRKLQGTLDKIEHTRREATDFSMSLTDDERQLILERRSQK